MRTLGILLLAVGIFGFVYASDQLKVAPPLPEDLSWRQALDHPAGKWDTIRYACGASAGFGFLLLVFPKGR
jgi:hypothetical protein